MTYNVFGGTLNLALSINQSTQKTASLTVGVQCMSLPANSLTTCSQKLIKLTVSRA